MEPNTTYDAIVIGGGHNGLIAACYLGMAGQRVLILEKNEAVGGATFSKTLFPGVDARVSVYSYLVSLLPPKILSDLGLRFDLRQRSIASYTPVERGGKYSGLLISNASEEVTRQSFMELTGDEREYQGYRRLQEVTEVFARKVWPTLLSPLLSKDEMQQQFQTPEERRAWEYLVELPLAHLIEDHLSDDTVRGAVFTDAKIGVLTHPEDPSLLQNRTFLYHTIGQGTGEWRVPVGGMGSLVHALEGKARALGVMITTSAEVMRVEPAAAAHTVHFRLDGNERSVKARYVLFNTASNIANRCLPGVYQEEQVEGAVFKINMVLKGLPAVQDPRVTAREAFTGTLHINEGYENMKRAYRYALGETRMADIPGEVYCHSLTDPSILSPHLQAEGYQTLTLFGLDVPYHWFALENAAVREEITGKYLRALSRFTGGDFRDCLAQDADGSPCLEAKSPLDLENSLGLPQGNIFHGNLSWPFAENKAEAGTWGVETQYENIYICGSSAKRGGAVSGIPGHNAAMKILGRMG